MTTTELTPGGICDWCTRPFKKKPFALHQRFCCTEHRVKWHQERTKRALKALTLANGEQDKKEDEK